MAEFGKITDVRTTADAFGSIPQPPPYGLHPPPYSAISSPNPFVLQTNENYAPPGYQPNYPASPPYSPYPTYPTAPQPSNAHPQYAGYEKSVAASSVAFAAQNTGAAAAAPILPYFVNQHPTSICVFNTQNTASTYLVNQQQYGSTYVINQQQIAPTFVVNQQHPAPPVVLIQSGNVAKGNRMTRGYPTEMTFQQSAQNVSKALANIALSNIGRAIHSSTRNKEKQVTVTTGGNHVIIYK
ncbi:MHC class II regulatory factor RFX1-like [Chiloscyllium plagiosum]|uniref:MHC class II regulatory factor RFX1-like n=1 Tax=Chiloscyllium plagiosum TaxID=36176 RepID=UPI001CB7AE8D|nr:MHC class II regulatory factor RFX1-like [Chiloscyllium plagiosum]